MPNTLQRWRQEALILGRLSVPLLIGQLAQTGMGATDTIMAGRYSAEDLAAVAVGQSLWLPILIFFVGLFSATTTLVAHSNGAGNHSIIKQITQQSLWIALFTAPFAAAALLYSEHIAIAMGVDLSVATIMDNYMTYLAFGIPAAAIFFAMRGTIEGSGQTRPIMLLSLGCFLANIPLNYLLIFGKLGLPALGGAGCGIATSTVLWIQVIGVILICQRHHKIKPLCLFSHWQKPLVAPIKQLLNLGIPIALTMVAEISLFSVVALLIAPLGTNVIAGHQIALSVSAITFMFPLSNGIAITIQTGHCLGAKQYQRAKLVSLVGIGIGLMLAFINMAFIYFGREAIAGFYTVDDAVLAVATGLLVYTAIYQIPDTLQISATHALRGYRDTKMPLAIVLFSYWVISVPIGWCLTMGKFEGFEPLGAAGMWIGLVIGLSVAACLQSWRFIIICRRQLAVAHS